MEKIYSFVVPGVPVAQGRPRFSKANGFVVAYDPEKSKSYKAMIAYIANLKNSQLFSKVYFLSQKQRSRVFRFRK